MKALRPAHFVLALLAPMGIGPACTYDYDRFTSDHGEGGTTTISPAGGTDGTELAGSAGTTDVAPPSAGGSPAGGTTTKSSANGGSPTGGTTTTGGGTNGGSPTGGTATTDGGTTTGGSTLSLGGTTGAVNTTCTKKQTLCSAGCTDLRFDSSNCGACGVVCPGTMICDGSVCH